MDRLSVFQQNDAKISSIRFLNFLPSPNTAVVLYLLRIGLTHRFFNPFLPDNTSVRTFPNMLKIRCTFHNDIIFHFLGIIYLPQLLLKEFLHVGGRSCPLGRSHHLAGEEAERLLLILAAGFHILDGLRVGGDGVVDPLLHLA